MALNRERNGKSYNPLITSEKLDLIKLSGENRLRALAMTIPSSGHYQHASATQSCISATIHATYEYLSQLIAGLSLSDPSMARLLVVSASGLDAISWLERTNDSQHGWLPNYPVSGYITLGMLKSPPSYGMTPHEPAIVLSVNRSNDMDEDFFVDFTVSEEEHMRFLSMLINDAGDVWEQFESLFGITPCSSIPLPEEVKDQAGAEMSCRNYLSAFIKHVVDKADVDSCLESFDLQFSMTKTSNLHDPIVAATALFNAYSLYHTSAHKKHQDKCDSRTKEILTVAIETGLKSQYWHDKEQLDSL